MKKYNLLESVLFSIVALLVFLPAYYVFAGVGDGSVSVTLPANFTTPATVTVTVSGTDAGGNAVSGTGTITINPPSATPITITNFVASPAGPLTAPGATNLTWTTNADSCDASGTSWSGTNIHSGDAVTQRSGMPAGSYTFGLICHKTGVTDATASVSVTVNAGSTNSTCSGSAPTCSLSNSCGTLTNTGVQICTNGSWGGCTATAPSSASCPVVATCPAGTVGLSSTNITVGQSVNASASANFGGGTFSGGNFTSSNGAVGSVSGFSVTGASAGTATISGNGWTNSNGATNCSLTGATLTVTSAQQQQQQAGSYTITVTKAVGGTVSSSPAGISCGSTCVGTFTTGTSVTLTETPATNFKFAGWGGDCGAGVGTTCTLTVNAAKNVTAKFIPIPANYQEF